MNTLPDEKIAPDFLSDGGEMGGLIRNLDWGNTAVGPITSWQFSLRTTLGIILHSSFPMLLFWGDEMNCFYNDAFRPSLGQSGKHPESLGKPGAEMWAEIWHIIKPWLDEVMIEGKAIWRQDELVPFYRNGRVEDIYWTFSYSPAYGDNGAINGVFVTCVETTDQVASAARFKKLLAEKEASEQRFRNLVRDAPVGIAVFRGKDLIAEIANDAYLPLTGRTREQFVGKPLFESLPETEDVLAPIIKEVIETGTSFNSGDFELMVHRHGQDETCYFNFIYHPIKENDGSIDGFMVVVNEITQQVLARKASEENEHKLRTVIEAAPFPIGIYMGREMRIAVANEVMLETWGKGHDVIGKLYSEILPELDNQSIFEQLDRVYTTGKPYHANNQRVDIVVDGQLQGFYFKYSFTPLFNAAGEVYGVMNTAADVTDLMMARQLAKELDAKKDEFLSIASHELKTPVTSIKLFNQLLDRQLDQEEQKIFLKRSALQIKKLERLIGDLLDVSKITSGHVNYQMEEVSLNQIIMESADVIRMEGAKHEIIISNLPEAIVMADKVRLEQVIYNLINNAIKYSPRADKINIALQLLPGEAQLMIQDYGIGISRDEVARIFDRFYRVAETAGTSGGLGLGLFISSQIMKAHGGSLWVESEPGQGSAFYISLPLRSE